MPNCLLNIVVLTFMKVVGTLLHNSTSMDSFGGTEGDILFMWGKDPNLVITITQVNFKPVGVSSNYI